MAADFQWMTGFECSSFPQVGMDELEETQHYRCWASDLVRLRDTSITMVRYGIPWPQVNPRRHQHERQWTDQALDLMPTLAIRSSADLVQLGKPVWNDGGIMIPIFGEMQGWYARTFAQRYPQIIYYTPTNEPYICATYCAEWGNW